VPVDRSTPATGDIDYKIMTSSEKVAVYYDIRFTFEIVAGQGTVRVAP
jgi:hypothetical protein